MKRIAIITSMLAAVALAGCTTNTRQNYEVGVTALQGSQRLQAEMRNKCLSDFARTNVQARHQMAVVANVSDAKAGPVLCSRLLKAIVKRTLTYDDFIAARYGRISPKFVLVMQGRI